MGEHPRLSRRGEVYGRSGASGEECGSYSRRNESGGTDQTKMVRGDDETTTREGATGGEKEGGRHAGYT